MNKSFLILKREYLTRVKKKSFIIMTLLVPLMMAAFTILPAYLASMDDTEQRTIAVYDPTGLILNKLENQPYTKFHYIPEQQYNEMSKNFKSNEFYALLFIPPNILTTNQAQLISDKQITFDIKNMVTDRIAS
ncbi:MAG: ABC transporter permease, partial [Bacteroidales bacterium]